MGDPYYNNQSRLESYYNATEDAKKWINDYELSNPRSIDLYFESRNILVYLIDNKIKLV